ncbi:hypothetical protein XELAEV_18002111mg [Xenopus laevis]|uniref:Uncharacterized protein n=1 Tax=Xenopus laevis TaxID=8355 RepID=A0A974GYN2_XENLA|nr:hypothetical protein XELAEV_18002111mg [Xenopus laevis]
MKCKALNPCDSYCFTFPSFYPLIKSTSKSKYGLSVLQPKNQLPQDSALHPCNKNVFSFSDLAQHYLVKANITAVRRVRKTDNNRIAR